MDGRGLDLSMTCSCLTSSTLGGLGRLPGTRGDGLDSTTLAVHFIHGHLG